MQRFIVSIRRAMALTLLAFFTNVHAASFTGTGTGAIPDGTDSATCNVSTSGMPLTISFDVSGLTASVFNVGMMIEFSPGGHTHIADLHAVLASPGASRKLTLFGDTGTDGRGGAGAHVAGPYLFADNQTGDWWSAAIDNKLGTTIPSGGYRSSGEATATLSSLNTAFGGLTTAEANGVWTLQVSDDCIGDTGSIAVAELFINDTQLPVKLETYSVD